MNYDFAFCRDMTFLGGKSIIPTWNKKVAFILPCNPFFLFTEAYFAMWIRCLWRVFIQNLSTLLILRKGFAELLSKDVFFYFWTHAFTLFIDCRRDGRSLVGG